MKNEKTKGDILAERIEAIKSDFDGLQGLAEILGEALADYHRQWTLGRTVNGFTLRDGEEWHRNDWTKDMLPEGWRPLLKGERTETGDEFKNSMTGEWNPADDHWEAHSSYTARRTRRPLPVLTPEQIADGWIEWHGGECPVWKGSHPVIKTSSGAIMDGYTASFWKWGNNGDKTIIAYRPDPYEALKKAHSEGKVIQCFDEDAGLNGEWHDLSGVIFWDCPVTDYRVKPAPVMVPLGPEDVPPGSVIRYIETFQWFAVLSVSENYVMVINRHAEHERLYFNDLMKYNEISRDGGKTWQKCEKEAK
jgi:hypothetical protein